MQVTALLQSGEDAAVLDARRRPAYAVAANKDVRDAFRRFVAAAGQSLGWSAEAAGIPSALTPEMEAQQANKQVRPAPAILQWLVPTKCVLPLMTDPAALVCKGKQHNTLFRA